MRYLRFTASTPYCGTDNERYVAFPDGATDEDVKEYADDFAKENAESFEYLVFGWGADPVGDGEMTEEEYEETMDNFYADCHCEYEDISKEEFEKMEEWTHKSTSFLFRRLTSKFVLFLY